MYGSTKHLSHPHMLFWCVGMADAAKYTWAACTGSVGFKQNKWSQEGILAGDYGRNLRGVGCAFDQNTYSCIQFSSHKQVLAPRTDVRLPCQGGDAKDSSGCSLKLKEADTSQTVPRTREPLVTCFWGSKSWAEQAYLSQTVKMKQTDLSCSHSALSAGCTIWSSSWKEFARKSATSVLQKLQWEVFPAPALPAFPCPTWHPGEGTTIKSSPWLLTVSAEKETWGNSEPAHQCVLPCTVHPAD